MPHGWESWVQQETVWEEQEEPWVGLRPDDQEVVVPLLGVPER